MSTQRHSALVRAVERATRLFDSPPRCHLFRSPTNRYLYDTNTGHIFAIDEMTERLLVHLGTGSFRGYVLAEAAKHGEDAVATKIEEIVKTATDHSPRFLSTAGPEEIAVPYDPDKYRRAVNEELQQMVLSITDACNLRCRYCVYSGKYALRSGHGCNRMARETVDAALRYFVAHTVCSKRRTLGFYGGEPTTAFDVIEYAVGALERALPRGSVNITITTNFAAVTPKMLRFFVDHDIWLYVSLDGPRELHDRYRVHGDGSGSFEMVMANLRALRGMAPDFYGTRVSFIQTSAPPYDYASVRRFFETDELVKDSLFLLGSVMEPETAFDDCDTRSFDASSVEPLRREYVERAVAGDFNARATPGTTGLDPDDPGSIPNFAKGRDFLGALFDTGFLYTHRRRILREDFPRRFFPGGLCTFAVRKLFVRWDGALYPCERVPEAEVVNLGRIAGGVDVDKIFDFYAKYAALTADECRRCWAILQCREMCFRNHTDRSDLCRSARVARCEAFRASFSDRLAQTCAVLERSPRAFDFLNGYRMV